MNSYQDFLASKLPAPSLFGREADPLPSVFYPFQAAIVKWAIKRGRAAIFSDCGTGKTLMQLEWARQSGDRVLIVAPLAVTEQTIAEADRMLSLPVRKVARPTGDPGIEITNFEKIEHFINGGYDAIVIDESSRLKSLDGEQRTLLIKEFTSIPRRLCCTATPAPNDIAELANHAEFLGVMPRVEMLAAFFVHDSDGAGSGAWRLKGHAQEAFWRWVAKWAVYIRKPSDLGFDDGGFILPELRISEESVRSDWKPDGMLFAAGLGGIENRREVRRATIQARVDRSVEIIQGSRDQWLVWCGLNDEQDKITKALGEDCVSIDGSTPEDERAQLTSDFLAGRARVLVTKPVMFGWGLNLQSCHQMLFLGIGDSFESYYQCIRRCWRFGQPKPVDVVIVVSEAEREIAANVRRKEAEAARLAEGVIAHSKEAMMEEITGKDSASTDYKTDEAKGDGWRLMLGDSIERIKEVESASVGLSVFSPPFASLYVYSPSERDLGNSKDYDQFFTHFGFMIPEILRITIPGRRCCVHVQQVTTTKTTHGVIGWRDFRADTVRAFVGAGWVYDGEVVIDKDPQAQAIRTKSKALMFVQKAKDSSWLRPAMADYILCFRHPGDNPTPIHPDVSNEEWILWARPIWYGIRESETLNAAAARSQDDERHICPLQLETIERCVRLWTNKGETVFSPFAGIGSEGYVALQHQRSFVGCELKEAYWTQAVRNLRGAKKQTGFNFLEAAGPVFEFPSAGTAAAAPIEAIVDQEAARAENGEAAQKSVYEWIKLTPGRTDDPNIASLARGAKNALVQMAEEAAMAEPSEVLALRDLLFSHEHPGINVRDVRLRVSAGESLRAVGKSIGHSHHVIRRIVDLPEASAVWLDEALRLPT